MCLSQAGGTTHRSEAPRLASYISTYEPYHMLYLERPALTITDLSSASPDCRPSLPSDATHHEQQTPPSPSHSRRAGDLTRRRLHRRSHLGHPRLPRLSSSRTGWNPLQPLRLGSPHHLRPAVRPQSQGRDAHRRLSIRGRPRCHRGLAAPGRGEGHARGYCAAPSAYAARPGSDEEGMSTLRCRAMSGGEPLSRALVLTLAVV